MKSESMVGRRLYAWIIDTILLFIIVFLFDGLVSQPISKKITNIEQIQTSYEDNSKVYESIQDEYNIYIYDENGNRLFNENIDEKVKEQFLNDQRIIDLNKVLVEEQETILTHLIVRMAISMSVPSLLVYCGLPLILGKGKTLGRLAGKLIVINDNETRVKWYKILLRGIITIILDVYLGLITMGILPLISLLIAVLTRDNKSLVDLICKTNVVNGNIPYLYKEEK